MRLRRLLLAAVVALTATLGAAAPASADDVAGTLDGLQLRGGVLEGLLTAGGLPEGASIDPASVAVSIGGTPVETTAEAAGGGTVARRVVLLVDVSGSMRGTGIDAARRAASAFLDAVPPDVQVGLVAFNDTAQVLAEPTTDRAAVRAEVNGLEPSRETALYDAVPVALDVLGDTGDRTVVLLSDGGDTVSLNTRQTAVAAVAASGARADVVGFRTDESQDEVLSELASAGRGRVSQAGDADALAAAFTSAAQALTRQVRLTAQLPEDAAGDVEVTVTARAGESTVTAASTVTLPERTQAPAPVGETEDEVVTPLPRAGATTATVPGWLASPLPIAVAVGAFILLLVLLMAAPVFEPAGRRRTRQLELYSMQGRRGRRAVQEAEETPGGAAQPFLSAAETLIQWRGLATGWALKLDRADMALKPNEWLVLRCAAVLVGLALGAVLGWGWFVALLLGVAGWVLTGLYLRFRLERRLAAFGRQLPDALALVASSLSTGFSLPQALDAVSRDTSEPMSTEIGRALAEARLGMELELALGRVAYRMRNEDLRWAVMAIQVQRQVGGNLAETLRTTVGTLRERSALRRHVKALSAEGVLSAYILIGLPIAITLWLWISNREYISLLFTNILGWLMIVVALIGMTIGSFWMRKVVKVEV